MDGAEKQLPLGETRKFSLFGPEKITLELAMHVQLND
jgi:hypothetical protein